MTTSPLSSRFIRFTLVGGFATGLQYILLMALVELGGADKIVGSATSFALSALANYALNYRLTFASKKRHRETLPKFLVTASAGLVLNTAAFSMLLALMPHYLLAQLGATAITLISNFLLHKHWIYRSHHDNSNSLAGDSRSLLQRRRSLHEDSR
jgi:putative flippase GtrA